MAARGQPIKVRETIGAEWPAKKWLKTHDVRVKALADLLHVSVPAVQLWLNKGITPFAFLKACVVTFAPTEGRATLSTATLHQGMRGFRLTPEMVALARKFDKENDGVEVRTTTGRYLVTGGDRPATPETRGDTIEVLLSLALHLKEDRDYGLGRIKELELQLAAERARTVAALKTVDELRVESQSWRDIADHATAPERTFKPSVPLNRFDSVVATISTKEPSLRRELESLPKPSGVLV